VKSNVDIGAIRMMNFPALDLNLLKVFDAVMTELSATRAGERLGLSQPAVSSALARLRRVTGDELFVRDGNRMVPTPMALSMREPVRQAMQKLEDVFSEVAGFDPATSRRTFTIIGSDYFSSLLMPRLIRSVQEQAPHVVLRMLDAPSGAVVQRLGEGTADAALDRAIETPSWINHRELFVSYLLCIAARDHPDIRASGIKPGERLPAELFCRLPQAILSMDGSRTGSIDGALKERGLSRHVAVTLPHFQAVALSVAESRLIASLPVHFARHVAQYLDIELYQPPLDPPKVSTSLYWHRRLERDAANSWLRDHVVAALDLDNRFPLA
jgi:DNA-binding transcriptional LysR family regulator